MLFARFNFASRCYARECCRQLSFVVAVQGSEENSKRGSYRANDWEVIQKKIRSSLQLWMDNNEDGRQRSKAAFIEPKMIIFPSKKGMLIYFRL